MLYNLPSLLRQEPTHQQNCIEPRLLGHRNSLPRQLLPLHLLQVRMRAIYRVEVHLHVHNHPVDGRLHDSDSEVRLR